MNTTKEQAKGLCHSERSVGIYPPTPGATARPWVNKINPKSRRNEVKTDGLSRVFNDERWTYRQLNTLTMTQLFGKKLWKKEKNETKKGEIKW